MWIEPTPLSVKDRTNWTALEDEDDKPFFMLEHYDPVIDGTSSYLSSRSSVSYNFAFIQRYLRDVSI
jgi:hypothetical protein